MLVNEHRRGVAVRPQVLLVVDPRRVGLAQAQHHGITQKLALHVGILQEDVVVLLGEARVQMDVGGDAHHPVAVHVVFQRQVGAVNGQTLLLVRRVGGVLLRDESGVGEDQPLHLQLAVIVVLDSPGLLLGDDALGHQYVGQALGVHLHAAGERLAGRGHGQHRRRDGLLDSRVHASSCRFDARLCPCVSLDAANRRARM